jgi:cysteine-rich repeat protein
MKFRVSKLLPPMFLAIACSGPDPKCGDEEINVPGEECDDGNNISNDGCENDCTETPQVNTQTLFVTQLTEMKDAALLVKEAAEDSDLQRAQQQWRLLWQRGIKLRYLIEKVDSTTFLRIYGEVGLRDVANPPGVHGVEVMLFGKVSNLSAVPALIDALIVELDALIAANPTITEEQIYRAALAAYRLPIEIFAGAETPLAGPDEDALRNLFISTRAYFELIPDLLANEPELTTALNTLGQASTLGPDQLPILIAASINVSQAIAQTAQDRGVSVGVTPQTDFSQLTIPKQFGDNFTFTDDPEAIELGKLLFFDPILSSPRNDRSCSSCHHPDKNFTDNLVKGLGLDDNPLPRNTPTIFNSALQVGSFWDSRVNDLPDQAVRPIESEQEMGTDLVSVVNALNAIPEYVTRFNAVFTDGINPANIGRAIATWESSETLLLLNSPADQFLAGDTNALNAAEKRGAELFWGKARCGNCHFAPIYNGTRSLTFDRTDLRVIGVPQDEAGTTLDPDPGAGGVPGGGTDKIGAFKVPTLRNITETAPYMHNGVFATLDEVVDFYNAGGGPGLNLAVPNVDPRMIKLNLTQAEIADLLSFLGTLTDTTSPRPQAPVTVPSDLPVNGRGF